MPSYFKDLNEKYYQEVEMTSERLHSVQWYLRKEFIQKGVKRYNSFPKKLNRFIHRLAGKHMLSCKEYVGQLEIIANKIYGPY